MTLSRCPARCSHGDRCEAFVEHEGPHLYADHSAAHAPCDAPPRDQRETRKEPKLIAPARIELDLEDADAVADFLNHVAGVVRDRRRIVLIID